MKISVILPSLNPDEKLMLVVNGLIKEGFEDIIPNNANSVEEALGALLALGYSEKEAENTLKKVNKHESVENIIKECLRVLMG